MTVYVLECGAYADRWIKGVYATREGAEAAAREHESRYTDEFDAHTEITECVVQS